MDLFSWYRLEEHQSRGTTSREDDCLISAGSFPLLFILQYDVLTKLKYTLGLTTQKMTRKTRLHCCDDPAKIKPGCDEKKVGEDSINIKSICKS